MDDTQYRKQMMMLQIRRQWDDAMRRREMAATPEAKADIYRYLVMLKSKYAAVARS